MNADFNLKKYRNQRANGTRKMIRKAYQSIGRWLMSKHDVYRLDSNHQRISNGKGGYRTSKPSSLNEFLKQYRITNVYDTKEGVKNGLYAKFGKLVAKRYGDSQEYVKRCVSDGRIESPKPSPASQSVDYDVDDDVSQMLGSSNKSTNPKDTKSGGR